MAIGLCNSLKISQNYQANGKKYAVFLDISVDGIPSSVIQWVFFNNHANDLKYGTKLN